MSERIPKSERPTAERWWRTYHLLLRTATKTATESRRATPEVVEYRSDGSSPIRERFQRGLRSDWQMTDAHTRGGKDRIPDA